MEILALKTAVLEFLKKLSDELHRRLKMKAKRALGTFKSKNLFHLKNRKNWNFKNYRQSFSNQGII
jgi:hypothetical protein